MLVAVNSCVAFIMLLLWYKIFALLKVIKKFFSHYQIFDQKQQNNIFVCDSHFSSPQTKCNGYIVTVSNYVSQADCNQLPMD